MLHVHAPVQALLASLGLTPQPQSAEHVESGNRVGVADGVVVVVVVVIVVVPAAVAVGANEAFCDIKSCS